MISGMARKFIVVIGLTALLSPSLVFGQSESSEVQDLAYEGELEEDASDTSSKSVEADLAEDNKLKPAVFPIDPIESRLDRFYKFKDRVQEATGLKWGVDYTVLMQHASFTESGEDTASSSVFRILGTWLDVGDRDKAHGKLVWKIETRNPIFGNPTPRDMGFDTGSALSTANFKELDWGVTDFYWAQRFNRGEHAFLFGHMDPGDWADQYPGLNAWTSFMSDAFYNNPTEAIPKRGFGIVGQTFFTDNLYLMGGAHDANGKDGNLDFGSFWNDREWFKWVEFGYRGSKRNIAARHNVHLHYWHQDEREEAAVEKSHGWAFTYSVKNDRGGMAFLRAGHSKGDAAQMRRFIGGGATIKVKGRDTLGMAVSWGSPPDKSLRDQVTGEIYYRIQVTQNLTISPNWQLTLHPSFTLEKRWISVPGLRMRLVF